MSDDTNILTVLLVVAFWGTLLWFIFNSYVEDWKDGYQFGTTKTIIAIQNAMNDATQTIDPEEATADNE